MPSRPTSRSPATCSRRPTRSLEAIETGDRALLREELGDLLLQVLFHARLAEEEPAIAFSIDDVAADLVDKLVRRHPHVFAEGSTAADAADLNEPWEQHKIAEKGRDVGRRRRADRPAGAGAGREAGLAARSGPGWTVAPPAGDELGARLFALVRDAVAAGVDPEAALRADRARLPGRRARRRAGRRRSAPAPSAG